MCYRFGGELVAAFVVGDACVSFDFVERDVVESGYESSYGGDEFDVGFCFPVFAQHSDAIARIGVDEDAELSFVRLNRFEGLLDGGEFGDVVGAVADEIAKFLSLVFLDDDDADAHGAGVASASSIGPDDNVGSRAACVFVLCVISLRL